MLVVYAGGACRGAGAGSVSDSGRAYPGRFFACPACFPLACRLLPAWLEAGQAWQACQAEQAESKGDRGREAGHV
jgi:hypothetical protein